MKRNFDQGDFETTIHAATQGVKVCPADERLYQLRMSAHAERGDRAGVESAMTELFAVLEIALPGAHVSSETVEIHRAARENLR